MYRPNYPSHIMILEQPSSRLRRMAVAVLAVALAMVMLMPVFAFAAASAPETVAQSVSEATKVTWAWGEAAQSVAGFVMSLLVLVGGYLFRKLPENIVGLIGNARVELLLTNAENWGINAVKDATKDKSMTVDVGNAVLAQALSYALNNGSSWLLNWAGGPDGLAQKLWARLNLDPKATSDAVPGIIAAAVAKAA